MIKKKFLLFTFIIIFTINTTAAINGDINGDNKVNAQDYNAIRRHILKTKILIGDELKKADVNNDSKITTADYIAIRKIILKQNNNDYFAGTPAYNVNNNKIIVNGASYPNNKSITSGITYAVDDLGRETGLKEKTYANNKYVGLFYFVWRGEHGDDGIFNITNVINEGKEAAKSPYYSGWGPMVSMHFWGEPLYGYSYSNDEWEMRKHIEEFIWAGIDFLYIDVTNGYPYITNVKKLMSVIEDYYKQGFNPPKVVFYTNTNSSNVVKALYDDIYSKKLYPDSWFYLNNKPLIIAKESSIRSLNQDIYNFFTYREPQWPNSSIKKNGWPWMDFNYPQTIFKNKNNENEVINVSVAQHSGTIKFSDSALYGDTTNRGRSYYDGQNHLDGKSTLYGYNFQQQWDHALEANVPYVLVTGWNEWVAQRYTMNGRVAFVDQASMEFSRDIEPMKGGYFDNYYMQLIQNIRKYKTVPPTLIQNTRKSININDSFNQWDDILVTYSDPINDCNNRNASGFGHQKITDKSGNNDIQSIKITHDTQYLYFYIGVNKKYNMPSYDGKMSWMQIFINTDLNSQTGFYGYDYLINSKIKNNDTSTIAKSNSNTKVYSFSDISDAQYRIEENKMMIKINLKDLGITNYEKIKFAFKVVDSKTQITSMEKMYTEGDSAPIGRLNYIFQNY